MSQVLTFPSEFANDEMAQPLDHFIEEDGRKYAGRHITIDLYGAEGLTDKIRMEKAFHECIDQCGATLLHIHLHTFLPSGGLSGVAVLAESHISVHTWPEADYAAFDVFMCGDAQPEKAIGILQRAFNAEHVSVGTHLRGDRIEEMLGKDA